ncbi:MAG: SCO family protein [Acidobacteria bacterium]|nr:SCO family protein [Acidobacteriota bacterium]
MRQPNRSVYDVLQYWLASWRFPLFTICFLLFYTLTQLAVLLIPIQEASFLSQFADEFKTWCFGYDPATHTYEPAYLVMMITNPLMIMLLVTGIWWVPLRGIWQRRQAIWRTASFAAGMSIVMISGMTVLVTGAAKDAPTELPFPAESLRTEFRAQPIELIDHTGAPFSLQQAEGNVVLITAVYATCGYTCPMIMAQTKRAVAALTDTERRELRVLGITLDPKTDTVKVLSSMAQAQEITPPIYHLLTGDPDRVEHTLDLYGFSRTRNPETGVIDHANLFILVDRKGRVAYRFTLGDRQEEWLIKALKLLISERENDGSNQASS